MDEKYIELVKEQFNEMLEPQLIEEMTKVGRVSTIKEDEIVIDVNETITHIPLMLKGAIKIMREDDDGKEMFLYYIESGSTCAASLTCCMNNSRSNILAIVEEEATFLSVPIEYMDLWMVKYGTWRSFILSNYANRYEELLEVVDILAFKKMDDRVSNYLNEKATLYQTKTVEASHQKIAYDLNTSREVVSRILKQMERKGAVALKRGKIILTS